MRLLMHGLAIVATTATLILGTLLPFLPGSYDSLAEALSLMLRIFGTVGLLLVPVGALWVASEYWRPLASKQYGIAIVALVTATVVWVAVALGALVSSGPLLASGALAFWTYLVARLWPRLRHFRSAPLRRTSALGFHLLLVPAAVALLQMTLVPRAIEASRARAIRNSVLLIADIEQYRAANGRYPASLLSVWADYLPGVIGIKEYHYEPSGEAYNLFFEQVALNFGTREIVMFNPRDEQVMTSHKLDRLQLTPQQLAVEQTRGHYVVHDAPQPHWKYFWFD